METNDKRSEFSPAPNTKNSDGIEGERLAKIVLELTGKELTWIRPTMGEHRVTFKIGPEELPVSLVQMQDVVAGAKHSRSTYADPTEEFAERLAGAYRRKTDERMKKQLRESRYF
jgi:hypothetical protein